jgi:hypothetical protein
MQCLFNDDCIIAHDAASSILLPWTLASTDLSMFLCFVDDDLKSQFYPPSVEKCGLQFFSGNIKFTA